MRSVTSERYRGPGSTRSLGALAARKFRLGRSGCLKYARIKTGVPRSGKISSHHDLDSHAAQPGVDRSPYLKISLRNGAGLKFLQRSDGQEIIITGTHTGNTKCNWPRKMFSRLFSRHRQPRRPDTSTIGNSDSADAFAQRIRLDSEWLGTSEARRRAITRSSSRIHAAIQFARDLTTREGPASRRERKVFSRRHGALLQ